MFPDFSEVGKYFHEMFRFRWDEYRRSGSILVVNPTKRRKKFADEEGLIYKPLDFEIFSTISTFGMFEISRLAVFEKLLRRVSYLHLHLQCIADSGTETSLALEDIQNRTEQSDVSELSKVVKIGIRSIFELIKGSKTEYPDLCVRAVTSLFTILEGLRLEALCDEPSDIVGDIFNVLLNVVDECLNEEIVERSPDVQRLIEISSACLLSFAIIRGDTGKMLRAISAILISKYSLSHSMVLPNAVIELQKSVQSVITGKLKHPNWFTHGVLKSSCISSFLLLFTADDSKLSLKIKNLACDGYYLYIYTSYGLYKIGTGYNGTIPRNVYAHNPAFFGQDNGWIFYMKNSLYFMLMKQKGSNELYLVNENNLELQQMIRIDSNVSIFTKGLVFVDGDYLCSLCSPKEDELVIRSMEIVENNLTLIQEELRFQLSEKYFKLFGSSCGSEEKLLSSRCVGVNEELISFASGKEFSLLQTSDGKVLYNSKLGNQNLRAPGTRSNQCWVELICPKMSTVKQCVIGNDGSIGLLVYNDGSVYFIGFARRGEDGENGAVRRQCNQIKPRKMTRMDGKNVVYAACNHGSTALVTDKGELFMFGKDAIHCDPGTGYVSDLKHVRVRSVALGKVHVVVLTDKGHVYTFGYNGRGQCGRFSSSEGPGRSEAYMEVYVDDDENSASSDDTYSDVICLKGTHIFKQDKCMICPICHQCTGYGAGCLASNEGDREPGEECGCGDGDSGCAKCCICKICAFEEDPDQELDDENEPDDIIRINLFGAVYERNDRKVRAELFKKDEEPVAGPSGEGVEMINNSNGGKDSMSMVYLLPAKVHFRTTAPAVQIAAGLYHTVVLMENGEVYTFGSNTSGQLGINDENHIGPVKANLPPVVVEIAAGSNHTVALTATGEVFTFGNNSKNQLGRNCVTFIQTEGLLWHSTPQLIPNIGSQYAQKVTGIGASGDMTYLKISESLLSRSTLNNSKFVADKNNILMLPVDVENDEQKTFECVVIEKKSGNFRNFANVDQVNFNNAAVCYDSLYNVLWCIHENEPSSVEKGPIAKCYNVVASDVHEDFCSPNILDCELAVPVVTMHTIPCYQAAIHVLACLDMLAQARSRKDSFKSLFMEQKRVINTKSLRKEDFIAVNRFQGLGNSWTYNAHNAVEAIRFSCDTDVLLGGIGLYGGRGHYHVRLKLLDIGYESDPEPKDGQVIISTDEIVYECSLKQTYPFMFEEPVLLQANRWYIIWAQIKGSPSDCGSSGLPYLVTDDEVVFHFKSSLLSNNGTNVSSGQIPQLFYKVLLPEFYVVTNLENPPPAVIHILSRKFSHTVTEDGFKSLINLLSWCWEEFKMKYSEISNLRYSPSLLEVIRQFDKLVYINQACQHLIRAFIFEMYPDGCRVKERRSRMSYVMAELIGDVRELLQNILSDPFLFEHFIPKKIEDGSCNIFYKLVKHIIKECSSTFVACFYVFYPTPTQKWIYLSYLLSFEPENKFEHDFLITATLSALCASNICLKLIFPILLGGFDPNQLFQENKNTNLASNFYNYNPILAEVMMKRTEGEIMIDISSWLYVMGKLLEMASKPVEEALHGVKNYHHSKIALNSCQILSKLVAELSADAMGINVSILDEVQRRKDQMLHTTPIRFRRVNANRSWNTGNGSPDAICFTVDKPGVVIVGVAAFGGSGNYDYEIELLDEVAAKGKNNSDYNLSNPQANWRCIALSRGSFGSSDYSGKDMVELNFEYPTAVQENTKYIIKLRLRGNRTNNGELGQAVVTGPDDTVFNFISTEISFNGTSVSRGQLPYIIYYRYPQRTTQELRQKKFVENQAHEAIVTISNRIFSEITSILTLANESPDYKEVVDILVGAPIITALLPLLVTHLSPLVATNAKIACHVLKLIEELLPLVCQINKKIIANTKESTSGAESSSTINFASNFVTTSPHYSLVESDHPYKRATVSKYIVKFPESVLWLSLEFDPRCGTAQEEDVLKIYVPDFSSKDHNNKTRKVYRPLPRTYGNDKHAWPGTAIILPGNEVIFSLESASKYLSRDRGTTFGFRCLVIGFEMVNIDGIPRLELELTSLACRCASYLIKKNFVCSDDNTDAINLELAEAEYGAHCSVLNRGIDLYRKGIFEYDKSSSFTRYRRIHANGAEFHIQSDINRLPTTNGLMDSFAIEEMAKSFSTNTSDSNEHSFLMDFINYKNDTSGGRLARWLQPDSFVDVSKCEMIFPRTKIKCGWPTTLAIVTRDQYGDIVEIPDLKVKVMCIPQQKEIVAVESKSKDHSDKPDLSIPYKTTIVNKVRYSAMTFMKEFADYSFEELRYYTPTITLENEHLHVQSNHNGIHTANWTPAGIGVYSIHVTIDGYPMKKLDLKVEVKDTPHGLSPPLYSKSSCIVYEEKKLRFGKQYSAGLRIRAQPSLQCEPVGFVEPGGIVTYIDEVENEDGVWVKLIHECITMYCKQLYPEGWCLKYHKHYDFELLQTVVNQTNANLPEKITINNDIKVYRVVKCGVSGHNIRAYPSLKAPTVGMIFSDQSVTSDEQIYNKEGMWIKLDKEAMKRFDLKQYDSVWSLAVDKSQIVYLRSDFSINKDMFLKALKWDEISSKVTGTEVVDSSSTSSDDSDNDHNHNPVSSEESQHICLQTSKDTGSFHQKKKGPKSDRNVSISPRNIQNITNIHDDESTHERSGNQNLNLTASVPPTPKKKRLGEHVPKITTSLARMTSTSDLADSESSPSSRANTPQFGSFVDKFDKTPEISVFRISSMSDSSGAVSTSSGGYQASIDTSSDSVMMFASKISFEEKLPVVQTGTQTSPKILPKVAINMKPDLSMIKAQEATISFNCTTTSTLAGPCKSTEVEITDDSNKKLEPDRISRSSDDYSYEGMDSDDDLPSGIDDASSDEDQNESIIESPLMEKSKPETEEIKTGVETATAVPSTSQQEAHDKNTEATNTSRFNFVHGFDNKSADVDEIAEAIEWEKYYCIKDSKIKYKTGIRPSVAESVRAVFAAFLWHEGLAHDAMTCASYLKFYPQLMRKDINTVVRREHNSNRNKDVTLRYSVEVGLIGNDHHLIKPSTMKSLPSATNDSPHKTNTDSGSEFIGGEKNENTSSPLALECLVLLWNEVSNTCFQLFSKNYQQAATCRSNDEKDLLKESTISSNSAESDDNKKCVYKLPINFYKRFGTEEICELCNGKYPSPVTYHMKSTHKGCGKASISKGYSAEGKYTSKVKGTCGEGGIKGTPSYVLCEACRERHMQYRKFKSSMFQRYPIHEDGYSGQLPMHLIMKENALFALDLSSTSNKFLPMVSTMPKLKTFGCLAAFGIDGDVIPNEINSFAVETRRRVRIKSDSGDPNADDDTVNITKNFHRSMSMIGNSWMSNEDENNPPPSIANKRYSALCDLESGNLSAMCQPSSRLQSVLKDLRSSTSDNGTQTERPILAFLRECHNLRCLRTTMKSVMQKAIFKNYGLRAMDWLLRTVTMPIALHDIMWWFVSSFSVPLTEDNDYENDNEWKDEFDLTRICEHPLVDMALAGECRQQIPASFHTLLQTISDLMMIFPIGSPLQQMAIKCWGFQFTHSDYNFLHRSKLFVNISKILSRSENDEEPDPSSTSLYESHLSVMAQNGHYIQVLRDITAFVSITVSSQSQQIANLIDNSTETYWESGEEDRRKMKTIVINCPPEVDPRVVYVHVDNTRDPNHKVLSIMILTGMYADFPHKLKTINLDPDYCGWVTTFIPEPHQRMIRIDCKGDHILRIRQIKVTGEIEGESPKILQQPSPFVLQQRQCESETLKVFRLIIFQVFGELIETSQSEIRTAEQRESSDLKEHMVGILFSRRKLNNLQKQVCNHIVQAIKKETCIIKEAWEKYADASISSNFEFHGDIADSYCFEMLCMVSALSGSDVGRSYLAQQYHLISDLLTLLHAGTARLQRQVVLLLRRVLPEVSPKTLALITDVRSLPPADFHVLAGTVTSSFDINKRSILDIFLAVIAKILSIQVKAKNNGNGKGVKTVTITDHLQPLSEDPHRWYLKGTVTKELASEIDGLLKDMASGRISEAWQTTAKSAIAENLLNLANLCKIATDRNECLKYATFWIGLSSLCGVDKDHVEKLSSANWKSEKDGGNVPRPLCSNHDDGKTLAIIQCNICELLCLECDRFLHLSRKSSDHERKVCKEEEEAIKVDVHEGCGRIKLFWLLALVDSNTFKGVVEFRENSRLTGTYNRVGIRNEMCRFCGRATNNLSDDGICYDEECQQHATNACINIHSCGHICGGIKGEDVCLPCLHGCSSSNSNLKQDADDMCMICFTEALSAAPSIQLDCGHVFHYHCCENALLKRWPGPRITFNFQQCPICKRSIFHDSVKTLLSPIWDLMKDVRKKALMRLEYEGCPSNYEDPAAYAMEKYAYYVCFKCKKAYYGGEARCEAEVDNSDFNPEELICGGCSDISGARVCPKHGTDFLEYKCRYCCSVAVYFCFGTTHFCNACHEDFQNVITLLPSQLPSCPAGPKGTSLNVEDCPLHIEHPPTGEEFALGCGVCRTGRNF
ncbi:E3 ubiquitin-protein ligase MYCBP2 isoform X3 [Planococcus citri]|uniref:E3 ubiquitin-protein ligase MYCBP2 isoform X3 n=1 Tax=Planococcus citri TaxID=170843 RepID=UPI0031FA2C52